MRNKKQPGATNSGLPSMILAKEKPGWASTKTFCSLGTNIKSLKMKWRIKFRASKNSKTQLRYKTRLKLETNK